MRLPQTFLALAACFLLVSGAQASAIYSYVGKNFNTVGQDDTPPNLAYTTLMSVTGSFTTNTALGLMAFGDISGMVTGYSFNDGRTTLTDAKSTIGFFDVAVDALGDITQWSIQVKDAPPLVSIGDQTFTIVTEKSVSGSANDLGQIVECVALACTTAGNTGTDLARINGPGNFGTWTVVPIPASVWLFGSALGLLGWIKRRKTH